MPHSFNESLVQRRRRIADPLEYLDRCGGEEHGLDLVPCLADLRRRAPGAGRVVVAMITPGVAACGQLAHEP